ncbi:MAG: DeoR/GlpR family DNA-binding transcription regulator [Anaerolineales bacterium]|jgi:DeoR/GlpR family transcriptional regulator of sugar metabolism|nr:DeoR/GlpR family DNA-binding transcription regulator [Anaerolineales bacterium]
MARSDRENRLDTLRKIIKERHTLSKSELLDAVSVSRMTLFRDLEALEEEGFIEDLYGSVTLKQTDYDLQRYKDVNIENKRKMAQAAARFIQDEDVIFIGAGTTTLEITRVIVAQEHPVTIITNFLPVATETGKHSHINLVMLGGYYHRTTRSFIGPITRAAINSMSIRIVFFGANGVDLDAGLTGYFADQCELIREMIRLSKFSVGVADSTKFGKLSPNRIAYLDQINMLITDSDLSPEYQEGLSQRGYTFILA